MAYETGKTKTKFQRPIIVDLNYLDIAEKLGEIMYIGVSSFGWKLKTWLQQSYEPRMRHSLSPSLH